MSMRTRYRVWKRDFRYTNLSGLDLSGMDLSQCAFTGSVLYRTNLTGANLRGAQMRDADLRDATLHKADLTGADLSMANLSGTTLQDAQLNRALLPGAQITDADLCGASLVAADLRGAQIDRSNLDYADLQGAQLRGTWIRQSRLWGTKFGGEHSGVLAIGGTTVGEAYLIPEPGVGWRLTIVDSPGSVEEITIDDLDTSDPEQALIAAMCQYHAGMRSEYLGELRGWVTETV